MGHSSYMLGVCSVAVGVLCLTLFSRPVQAEMYVAGQVGMNIPYNLSNVEWRGFASTRYKILSCTLPNWVTFLTR